MVGSVLERVYRAGVFGRVQVSACTVNFELEDICESKSKEGEWFALSNMWKGHCW